MIPGALLPPVQKPPHDPKAFILSAAHLRNSAVLDGVQMNASRTGLVLEQNPSAYRMLHDTTGSFGGLTHPTNVAVAPDGNIYLIDQKQMLLKRFDPCDCRFVKIPCFVGKEGDPRRLIQPSGIGISQGCIFICDLGEPVQHHASGVGDASQRLSEAQKRSRRLIVLSLAEYALLGLWTPPPQAYEGTSPRLRQVWRPFDVEFGRDGRVYVSDKENECIHRFSPRGRWLGAFPNLGPVTHLTIDCQDRLYAVVDKATRIIEVDTASGKIASWSSRTKTSSSQPASSARTKTNIVADMPDLSTDDLAPRFPGLPFSIDHKGRLHPSPLCRPTPPQQCGGNPAEQQESTMAFDLSGEPVSLRTSPSLPSLERSGEMLVGPLDSEVHRCVWHRLILMGEIPPAASIQIRTYTSESAIPLSAVQAILSGSAPLTSRIVATPFSKLWDGLITSSPGRYLWVQLTFQGNGYSTPIVRQMEIEFPRISLRRFLPAVFGEEPVSADFTDRFLGIFDTTIRSIEFTLDHLARYFDPTATPSERRAGTIDFLTWLGSWVGMTFDRQWPEEKRRRFLKQAGKLFAQRGTVEGLRQQLLMYLGMEPSRICCMNDRPKTSCSPQPRNCRPTEKQPCFWKPPLLILEHFQLRRWLFLGQGHLNERAMLWGRKIVNRTQLGNHHAQVGATQLITRQDPLRDPFHVNAHQFTVFVPAKWKRSDSARKGLENLLKSESPAHTKYTITYVKPHFRLGVQSMVGFDTAIGRYPQGVVLDEGRLGQGTVLTGPPTIGRGLGVRVGKDARIGTTTRLHA